MNEEQDKVQSTYFMVNSFLPTHEACLAWPDGEPGTNNLCRPKITNGSYTIVPFTHKISTIRRVCANTANHADAVVPLKHCIHLPQEKVIALIE